MVPRETSYFCFPSGPYIKCILSQETYFLSLCVFLIKYYLKIVRFNLLKMILAGLQHNASPPNWLHSACTPLCVLEGME